MNGDSQTGAPPRGVDGAQGAHSAAGSPRDPEAGASTADPPASEPTGSPSGAKQRQESAAVHGKVGKNEATQGEPAATGADTDSGSFLSDLAHELRTPLNAVINAPASLLPDFRRVPCLACGDCGARFEVEQGESERSAHDEVCPKCEGQLARGETYVFEGNAEEAYGLLKRCVFAGKHLLGLVNDILDYTKLQAGRMELYLERLEVSEVFERLNYTLRPLAEERGVDLVFAEPDEPLTLDADIVKLSQVLINIGANAIKYTEPPGMVTVACETRTEDGDEMIQFSVQDTGVGIAAEDIESIFERFERGRATDRRSREGTGLGLPIARMLTERHHGTLKAVSEVGRGSCFSAILPRWQGAARPQPTLDVVASGSQIPRILVVDDDETALAISNMQLQRLGYSVNLVEHPERVLDVLLQDQPDVLILDVMMPRVSGLDILREIQNHPKLRGMPIIVTTAFHGNQEIVKRFGVRWLPKPWRPQELLEAVRSSVRQALPDAEVADPDVNGSQG